jgi:hypothetical protein
MWKYQQMEGKYTNKIWKRLHENSSINNGQSQVLCCAVWKNLRLEGPTRLAEQGSQSKVYSHIYTMMFFGVKESGCLKSSLKQA